MAKKTIYMNEPLEKLAEKTRAASARNGGFSSRLGEIVDRYDMIMELTPMPELTDTDTQIIAEAVCGSRIDIRKVRGLHLDVLDCELGTADDRKDLSARIEAMGPAERLKIIEGNIEKNEAN